MASTVWKGHLSFGLVSVPVKLTCAARAEPIAFCQLRATDMSRVGQSLYAKADNTPITKDEIVKGFETGKDKYVIVTPEEIASAAPASADNAEIQEFVPAAEVDPICYEQSYWLAPDTGGDKAYALLYDGLKRSGFAGIAKITMHSREHVIALRAGKSGIAVHTLYYHHEARANDEYKTDTSKISAQESELAGMLMTALSSTFDLSKFRDTYRENLLALIEAKGAGLAAPAPIKPQAKAASTDILEALKASLTKAKPGPVAVPDLPPPAVETPAPGPVAVPRKRAPRKVQPEVAA